MGLIVLVINAVGQIGHSHILGGVHIKSPKEKTGPKRMTQALRAKPSSSPFRRPFLNPLAYACVSVYIYTLCFCFRLFSFIKKSKHCERLRSMPGLTCNACNTEFNDDTEQKLHYKSEWHRYNLKRKVLFFFFSTFIIDFFVYLYVSIQKD